MVSFFAESRVSNTTRSPSEADPSSEPDPVLNGRALLFPVLKYQDLDLRDKLCPSCLSVRVKRLVLPSFTTSAADSLSFTFNGVGRLDMSSCDR